jgi:hypothetical protein
MAALSRCIFLKKAPTFVAHRPPSRALFRTTAWERTYGYFPVDHFRGAWTETLPVLHRGIATSIGNECRSCNMALRNLGKRIGLSPTAFDRS